LLSIPVVVSRHLPARMLDRLYATTAGVVRRRGWLDGEGVSGHVFAPPGKHGLILFTSTIPGYSMVYWARPGHRSRAWQADRRAIMLMHASWHPSLGQ
jgi:hypothetical protein